MLTLREMLSTYLDYRKASSSKRTKFELRQAQEARPHPHRPDQGGGRAGRDASASSVRRRAPRRPRTGLMDPVRAGRGAGQGHPGHDVCRKLTGLEIEVAAGRSSRSIEKLVREAGGDPGRRDEDHRHHQEPSCWSSGRSTATTARPRSCTTPWTWTSRTSSPTRRW